MTISDENLIWLDMEMTGLDPFTDHILEVATVITNQKLEILAEGPNLVVFQSEEVLGGMDEWNTTLSFAKINTWQICRNTSCSVQ